MKSSREHAKSPRSWWPFSFKYNWVLFPLTWSGERWASDNTPLLLCDKRSQHLSGPFFPSLSTEDEIWVLGISVDCAVVTSSEKVSPKGGAQQFLLPPSVILIPLHVECGVCVCVCMCVYSILSNYLTPHWLHPMRFLYLWDFPGNNTGVGCHFLLQGFFPTQGLNLCLLHW